VPTDKETANRITTLWLENYVDEKDGDVSLSLHGDGLREALDMLDGTIAGELAEAAELRELFALQRTRTREAEALWQAAMGKPDVLPDLGGLIAWLIQRAEGARREVWEKMRGPCSVSGLCPQHNMPMDECPPCIFESCPRLEEER